MTSPVSLDIMDAIEHLPGGATLVVPGVAWDDYEHLVEELNERPHLRVSYDCGRLEIMSPLLDHEGYASFFDFLVGAYADYKDIELESRGQTTWKLKALQKGVEADACYYVRNTKVIIGKIRVNLESDPPPDIAVEIDTTSDSRRKFPIYAALNVPELWIYDGKDVHIYKLTGRKYVEISESRFLPGLTASMLAQSIELSKTEGQRTALKAFRKRLSTLAGN